MEEIFCTGITDKGRRDHNEDAYLNLEVHPGVFFLAVADGMGGMIAGEVASQLVLEECEIFLNKLEPEQFKRENLKNILAGCFKVSQEAIGEYIKEYPGKKGMGTTLCAMLICDGDYAWGNIGDSRIYHFNSGNLTQITVDHSYIRDYAENNPGPLPDEIVNKYGNIVTRTINGGQDQADIFPENKLYEQLKPGDLFILCSDGLITNANLIDTSRWNAIIHRANTLEVAGRDMMEYALEENSTDNMSIILFSHGGHFTAATDDEEHVTKTIRKKPLKNFPAPHGNPIGTLFILLIGVIVGIGLSYAYNTFLGKVPDTATTADSLSVVHDSSSLSSNDIESNQPVSEEKEEFYELVIKGGEDAELEYKNPLYIKISPHSNNHSWLFLVRLDSTRGNRYINFIMKDPDDIDNPISNEIGIRLSQEKTKRDSLNSRLNSKEQ